MSDDTPTERFTPQGDSDETASNAQVPDPTRIFDAPADYANGHPTELLGASGSAVPASVPGRPHTSRERDDAKAAVPKARGLFFALIGVAALLLVAIIVLLILSFGPKDNPPVAVPTASPSPSAPPVETPSAEPTVTPPPPPPAPEPAGPSFDSFTAPSTSGCVEGESQHPLTFAWSSGNAERAYIGAGTTDAKAGPYESNLPPIYTYSDISYNCSQASQVYTVTLEDGAGLLTNRTVTITR
ncbi:MAG: hypothetical protein ACOH1T_04490 [Microbacteriaceae bacterium]